MKLLTILLTLIVASALGQQPWTPQGTGLDRPGGTSLNPTPGVITISGTVYRRWEDGLVIQTRMKGDGGLIFLTGMDAKMGAKISAKAMLVGKHEFFAGRMLDAYKIVQ